MAQIANNEPSIQDLISLFGNTAIPALESLSRSDQGRQSVDINQRQALQSMAQDAAMHPIDMETKNVVNETGRARLPGWVADSAQRTRTNTIEEAIGTDLPVKAGQAEFKGKISKEHQQELENLYTEMAASSDPTIAKHGRELFLTLPKYMGEEVKDQRRQDREIEKIKLQHKNTLEQNREFGRFRPATAAKDPVTELLSRGKLYEAHILEASREPPGERRDALLQMAEVARQKEQELVTLKANVIAAGSGRIDIPTLSNTKPPQAAIPPRPTVPTIPKPGAALGPGTMPQGGPTVASPKMPSTPVHMDWIKRMKIKHPNATDAEIIATGQKLGKFN